ncbi:MAG TPA: Stp1/IreP family PP2C-type Ser/Thr phosphatase [Polyangiaceae bacterium]|nr:Stp1/IreP family PP2C-type Ser/Thr phosphatase [Polyangiaceae bacterium]
MSDAHSSAPSETAIRFRLFGATDVGQVREHNEDNFLIADLATREREVFGSDRTVPSRGAVFGVCDGMGGAAAGEVASQLAVDIIFERLGSDPPATQRDELARRLVEAVEQAGVRIFHNARSDRARRGMGTTSTIGVLLDDRLFLAQVGDSRAYVYRGGALVQVTRDQSLVNQLIEAGQLTEQEADSFEHNNIILQALGTAETVQVDLTYVDLRRGDTLMMCSDGLSGMVKADEIKNVLAAHSDPMQAAQALIERANKAGGHDNITVIIVKFDGAGLSDPNAADPPLAYRKYQLPERERRRDTARPGVMGPTSSSPGSALGPTAPGGIPIVTPHPDSRGLKVGHTMIGAMSPVADLMRQAASADAPSAADPADSLPMVGWAPAAVGAVVVGALVLIASLGFWLLR